MHMVWTTCPRLLRGVASSSSRIWIRDTDRKFNAAVPVALPPHRLAVPYNNALLCLIEMGS